MFGGSALGKAMGPGDGVAGVVDTGKTPLFDEAAVTLKNIG